MNATEKMILNLIRKNKKLSNTEITKISGKHKSTISPCIQSLLKDGYIISAGTGSSTKKGGKPPLFLELNPKKLFTVGLSIEPEQITAIVTDFCGKIIQTHYSTYTDKNSTDSIISDIRDIFFHIITKESVPKDKIEGLGIGVSAQVDSKNGIIYKSESLKLTNVRLKERIEEYIPFPVKIINDVNASLLAEKWFVHDLNNVQYENFIYLFIGSTLQNMGIGIYLNNQLYEGSNHHAGEMRYYLTDKRLKSSLPSDEELGNFTIDKVKDFLNEDNKPVKKLLSIYSEIITEKMIDSIELLNPQKLIIGGNVINAEEEFLNPLINTIKSKTDAFFEDFLQIDVSKSELDELATPLGAITLFLSPYFK